MAASIRRRREGVPRSLSSDVARDLNGQVVGRGDAQSTARRRRLAPREVVDVSAILQTSSQIRSPQPRDEVSNATRRHDHQTPLFHHATAVQHDVFADAATASYTLSAIASCVLVLVIDRVHLQEELRPSVSLPRASCTPSHHAFGGKCALFMMSSRDRKSVV